VARLRTQRLTTREIAERIGTSQTTVQRDITALTVEWAQQQGDFQQQLSATLMDLDTLQTAAFAVLEEAVDLDKLPAMDRAFKAIELRAKLRGLFPKTGTEPDEMPTGPIRVELTLIDAGNRKLVTNSQEYDEAAAQALLERSEHGHST
jgi:predicted DNA-binding transcriptional regulator YafY